MTNFVFFGIIFHLVLQSDASRCFDCKNIPTTSACTTVTNCQSEEYCAVEQVVTSSGHIVYNLGCRLKNNCPVVSGQVVGKRSTNTTEKRSSQLTACIECCTGDFCNNQGCGTQSIPLGQRGPYCFNCDSVLNPQDCFNVAMCDVSEQCLLYSPAEYSGLPQQVYRSQCENKVTCTALSQALGNHWCPPTCCDTDLCNDQCTLSSNSMTTTSSVHIPTHLTTANQLQGSCKQDHLYDEISGICIYIDESRKVNYADAKRACENIGDQLVTLDTHEKTVFVENMLIHHSKFPTDNDRNYYIGLTDKNDNSVFYWPDGQKVYYTNWGGGDEVASNKQPDDSAHNPQNCVILYGLDHYRWHDDKCSHAWHFICEDRSINSHNGIDHSDPPPIDHSSTVYCDTKDGYMLLQSADESLCVRIVTQHSSWDDARAMCVGQGGDLVVLDNAEKAQLLRNKVNQLTYSGERGYWIGAKDFSLNNHFSWVNHQPVTYGDWYPGQPNHHDGGHEQDCACMWSSGEHYHWHDDYCAKHLAYICERI